MGIFKNLRFYGLLFFAYLVFGILWTFPLIFKLGSSIYGPFFNTDVRGTIWSLWWLRFSALHHLDYNNCYFLAAPYGVNFAFLPVMPINFIISKLLVVLTGYIFSVNFSTLIGFALTGSLGYLLIYELTKNKKASFVCGFIIAFCPYHLNKVMEFTYIFLCTWMILYIWALVKIKEKGDLVLIFIAAFAFSMTLAFNPYYAFFGFIFTICFLLFCFFFAWKLKIMSLATSVGRKELLGRARVSLVFIRNIIFVFVLVVIANAPALLGIAKKVFFQHTYAAGSSPMVYARSFDYLITQSARPLSYLLPASSHPIFGNFTKIMFGSIFYGRGSIEQTLYLGWVPLILSYFAFRQWRFKRMHKDVFPGYLSSRENFYIGFFIFSATTAFLCSLPPYAELGLFKIYFPSYFLYKILPIFRAYARFGIVVMLCVTVLAGYGMKEMLEKIKRKSTRLLFTFFIFSAILFEFTNAPPSRVTDISKIPPVYAWIRDQKGDFILAEYPMAMGASGEAQENYDYLFYQTIHQKRMVNGAIMGTKAFEIKQKILKIDDPQTVRILKGLGVKYVLLHSEPYRKGDYKESVNIVGEVPILDTIPGWKLIKTFDTEFIYEIVV